MNSYFFQKSTIQSGKVRNYLRPTLKEEAPNGGSRREGNFPSSKIDEVPRFVTENGPKFVHFWQMLTLKRSVLKSSYFG